MAKIEKITLFKNGLVDTLARSVLGSADDCRSSLSDGLDLQIIFLLNVCRHSTGLIGPSVGLMVADLICCILTKSHAGH